MQKITLICVGKLSSVYAKVVEDYEKRLRPLCQFKVVEVAEVVMREKQMSETLIRQTLEKEGERILAAVPKQARLAALCIEGRPMGSVDFSKWLCDASLSGQVALAIGSSHGLANSVKNRADMLLSLSEMTFPHQLARLVLTEQVYRAFMLRSNSPYHK